MEDDTRDDNIVDKNNSFDEETQKSENPGSPKIIVVKPALQPEVREELLQTVEKLKEPGVPKKDKLDLLNKLVELSEHIADFTTIIPLEDFVKRIRVFLVHPNKTLRTASLRVLRYYMKDDKFIQALTKYRMHFFIMRSLDREKQNEAERMQALKLVRKITEINCNLLPRCIVHSLVSMAEHPEDNFARVAVETMCEITIRNPKLSALCHGVKLIVTAIIDPNNQSIQESLILALVYLLNNEESRQYIRPGLDVGVILSPLTDNFYAKDVTPEKQAKWNASIRALVSLLKTWTGLITLASSPLGLKALVDSLKLPCPELHDRVLDALFDIVRLTVAKDSNPFQFRAQNRTVDESVTPDIGMDLGQDLPSRTRGDRHNLLNNYLSALLITFINAGLIQGLIDLGTRRKDGGEERKSISIKATLLLGELLFLTNTLLPASLCAKVQTLPSLVKYAASFSLDPRLRSRASSMVTNLHQYHHLKHSSGFSTDFHLSLIVTGANKWKRLKGRDRRLDRMDDVRMKIDFAMDIDQFRSKIQESQVIASKDSAKWKWDIVSDLLEGPFNNPTLVNHALTKTNFVKRILSFLRPSVKKESFSKMAWSQKNLKYVRMACQLFEVLVSSDSGRDFLLNSKLIPEIADQLKLEVDISNNVELLKEKKDARLLSGEGVLKTMSREYFTMLGTLSSSPRGLEILTKWKIFKYLIDLAEVQMRVDLSHLIMTSLDYNMPGDSRVILSKALTSASKVVRYLATRHMSILLRAGVQDFSDWGIDLLVKQLSDPDQKVIRSALSILDEACDETECLDSLIAKRPAILLKLPGQLQQPGKDLFLRFLSRTNGFKLLSDTNFINEEMELWKNGLNVTYVESIERALAEAFSPAIYKHRESDNSGDGVYLPPHFFGELAKTKEGCDVLEGTTHVRDFISCLQNTSASAVEQKAALWALGNIGCSKSGLKFVEKDLPLIVHMAETSPCLSIRGTCFYVLGMISRVEAGREILDSLGWESPTNLSSCISVPKNVTNSTFFKLPQYTPQGSYALSNTIEYPEDSNETRQEILTTVGHLSNFISAESASRTLKRIKASNPEHFQSASLVFHVFRLLGTYKYRMQVRRFIYDIFDSVNWDEESLATFDSM